EVAQGPPPPTPDSPASECRRFAASPPFVAAPTRSHPQRGHAGRDVPYAKLSFPAQDRFRQADRRRTCQDALTDDQAWRTRARVGRRLHPSAVVGTRSGQRKAAVAPRAQTGRTVRLTSHRPSGAATTRTRDLHCAESVVESTCGGGTGQAESGSFSR